MRRTAVELFECRNFKAARSVVELLLTLEDQPLPLVILYAICLAEAGEKDRADRVLSAARRVYSELPETARSPIQVLLNLARDWLPGSTTGLSSGSLIATFAGSVR